MADPSQYVDSFRRGCLQQPPDPPTPLWESWTEPYAEYTVRPGDTLRSIARVFAASGDATEGLDWRLLARFNFGADRPPHVNWCLIDRFDFAADSNLTRDRRSYKFDGAGDEILRVPLRPGTTARGAVSRRLPNTLVIRDVEVAAVEGPTFVTEGIPSTFRVTGYSVQDRRVTDAMRASVRWKVKDMASGSETEQAEQGEQVELSLTGLGKRYRVYPYLRNTSELVRCDLRVIRVELEHEIKLTDVDDEALAPDDPINKIHNPAALIIGASAPETCAKFRLTEVEPDDVNLAPNDSGFTWRLDNTRGEGAFREEEDAEPGTNIGSDCEVYGVRQGLVKLQGFTTFAVRPCVELTLMVVREREIPYRANFIARRFMLFFSRKTDFTPAKVADVVAIANIHLRQIGLKIVPDSDATLFQIGSERIEAIDGRPGYYDISRVPAQYVENIRWADVESACRINSRPGVVNFNFVISYNSGAWGLGPCSPHNLYSSSYTGPDETGSDKTSRVFDTPANVTSSESRSGILIMDPTLNESPNDTKTGAVIAHELGHNLALWHRGTPVSGDQRDGLPMSHWNLMYAFVNRGGGHWDTQTDADLVQLTIARGSALAAGVSDGLAITADNASVRGATLSTTRVNLTASRRGTAIPNTRFKVWELPHNTTVATVADTDLPANGISASGRMWIDIGLMGDAGSTARILVMAGENDDVATKIIDCAITDA